MPWPKEERNAYMKEYRQSPSGKKSKKITSWKDQGIIVQDYNKLYDSFLSMTNCQLCKKELTIDKKITHSTKCLDHDHLINNRPNVRMICCHACNLNDRLTNTSGEPNIHYNKSKKWSFYKTIQGKRYSKGGFKTKQEAIDYKLNFLLKLRIEPPKLGEDQSI